MKTIILFFVIVLCSCNRNPQPVKTPEIPLFAEEIKSASQEIPFINEADTSFLYDGEQKNKKDYPSILAEKYPGTEINSTYDGNFIINNEILVDSLGKTIISRQPRFLIEECWSGDDTTLGYYVYQPEDYDRIDICYGNSPIVKVGFFDPKGKMIVPIGKYAKLYNDGSKIAAASPQGLTIILNQSGQFLAGTNFDYAEWIDGNACMTDGEPIAAIMKTAKNIDLKSISLYSRRFDKSITVDAANIDKLTKNFYMVEQNLLQYMLKYPDHGDFFDSVKAIP